MCEFCVRHLLLKLIASMSDCNLLGAEQMGFCEEKSTDHCIILAHLAWKRSGARGRGGRGLFIPFLDLKGAFDLISRNLLWNNLQVMGTEKWLLFLIWELYSSTSYQLRHGNSGVLISQISIHCGVKLGCILAPYLFHLFLNDLSLILREVDGHFPKLGSYWVPSIIVRRWYSCTIPHIPHPKNVLSTYFFTYYCESNRLSVKFEKSKFLVFLRS